MSTPTATGPVLPAGSAEGGRSRRDRVVLLVAIGAIVVLAAGALISVLVVRSRLDANLTHLGDPFAQLTDRPPTVAPTAAPTTGDAGGPAAMNVLVLGSDSRISAGDPSQWTVGAQRTDAIMLVHLPQGGKHAYVMSIPRDSWVDVPGHGKAKINAAFSYGGPALLIETVEQLTKVRIDHFAVTDFTSFKAITDELGGVQITLKKDLYDGSTLVFPAGKHLLDGEQALLYVRQRKNLPRGDFDRVQRQGAWMRAMFARMRNEGTLRNPTKTVPFLDVVTKSLSVDDGVTSSLIDDLVARARDLGSNDLSFFTVPVTGTGTSPDGAQSIVVLDAPALALLSSAVRDDTMPQYLAQHSGDVDLLPAVAP